MEEKKCLDYTDEILQEASDEPEPKPAGRSEDDGGIMFTAKTACEYCHYYHLLLELSNFNWCE